MDAWRTSELQEIAGRKIVERLDFAKGLKGLPKENVLKFRLDDGSGFCLRPSGTEPKIKIYFAVQQPTVEQAHEQMERLEVEVMMKVDDWT